jgi:hypothetical protein
MDKLLRLKLEILYRDFPIEQARQTFNDIKQIPPPPAETLPKRRKLRIPAGENK